jgi:hypothetical protein
MEFPLPVDSYHDQQILSIFGKLTGRIQREPLNLVATIIFLAAIIHTFLTAQFRKIAHRYQRRYEAIEDLHQGTVDPLDSGQERDKLIFRAELFNFMGEVEAVFGIWLVPLFVAIIWFHGNDSGHCSPPLIRISLRYLSVPKSWPTSSRLGADSLNGYDCPAAANRPEKAGKKPTPG